MEAAREEIDKFENNLLKDYRAELRQAVRDEQPRWWHSVLWSVIGALVFSLIVALFVFIGSTSEKTTSDRVNELIETLHTPIPTDSIAE